MSNSTTARSKAMCAFCVLAFPAVGMTAEIYRRLPDAEIRATVTNMEISEAHFSEQYMADGTVRIVDLGSRVLGTWKVKAGQICIEAHKAEYSRCKEIWISGKKYQLRFPGDPVPFDVEIQSMQPRGW